MSEKEIGEELRSSNPNMNGPQGGAGGMGVSSERVGPAGPGQEATDGVRDTSTDESDTDEDPAPEQAAGGTEENPKGIPPKAGYPSKDPRSEEHPFRED